MPVGADAGPDASDHADHDQPQSCNHDPFHPCPADSSVGTEAWSRPRARIDADLRMG
jgi:hypothetical protein